VAENGGDQEFCREGLEKVRNRRDIRGTDGKGKKKWEKGRGWGRKPSKRGKKERPQEWFLSSRQGKWKKKRQTSTRGEKKAYSGKHGKEKARERTTPPKAG